MEIQCPFRLNFGNLDVNRSFSSFIFDESAKYCIEDAIALHDLDNGTAWRYSELREIVSRCRTQFMDLNADFENPRVALITSHTPRVLFLHLAAMEIGCTLVCINACLSSEDMWQQMDATDCTHCVVESQFLHKIDEFRRRNAMKGLARCKVIRTLEEFFEDCKTLTSKRRATNHKLFSLNSASTSNDSFTTQNQQNSCNASFVFFSYGASMTSANTFSKPIQISQSSLITNLRQLRSSSFRNANKISKSVLLPISIHNLFGTIAAYLSLIQGATLFTMAKYSPGLMVNNISREKISQAYLTLAMVQHFTCFETNGELSKLDTLKSVIVGGSRFDAKIARQCKQFLPHLEFLHEIGSVCTYCSPPLENLNSIGIPLPGIIFRIVNLKNEKQICQPHEIGHLLVHGPQISSSIYRDDLSTEKLYTIENELKFIKSGEAAYYDTDGHVYLVDKIHEMIKYKDAFICPSQVESVLRNCPGISDCAIVQMDDPICGSLPAVFVVRKSKSLKASDVKKFVIENSEANVIDGLSGLRGGVFFVSEIPRSVGGRILRRRLKQTCSGDRRNSLASNGRTNSIAFSSLASPTTSMTAKALQIRLTTKSETSGSLIQPKYRRSRSTKQNSEGSSSSLAQ